MMFSRSKEFLASITVIGVSGRVTRGSVAVNELVPIYSSRLYPKLLSPSSAYSSKHSSDEKTL
jgi:hypothetical protein